MSRKLSDIANKNKYEEFLKRATSGMDLTNEDIISTLKAEGHKIDRNVLIEKDLNDLEKKLLVNSLTDLLGNYFEHMGVPFAIYKEEWKQNICEAYVSSNEKPYKEIYEKLTERKIIDVCLLVKRLDSPNMSDVDKLTLTKEGEGFFKKITDNSLDVLKAMANILAKNSGKNSKVSQVEIKIVEEALSHFNKEGKIINVLQETEDAYADIVKLQDKYTIRLGDGKRFVASDDVKIMFRDPSENPSWAVWFLDAVPLNKTPNLAEVYLMPKEEWQKLFPEPIENHPIICHASLWCLPEDKTGVLLHTAWHNIAVCYKWHIDKPLDIARIMFKAVAHPAHIARNFGMAPQLVKPGQGWFGK